MRGRNQQRRDFNRFLEDKHGMRTGSWWSWPLDNTAISSCGKSYGPSCSLPSLKNPEGDSDSEMAGNIDGREKLWDWQQKN